MQYRVIGVNSVGSIGGVAEDAKAALQLIDDLRQQGYERIVIKDEYDRVISHDEIVVAANSDTE